MEVCGAVQESPIQNLQQAEYTVYKQSQKVTQIVQLSIKIINYYQ